MTFATWAAGPSVTGSYTFSAPAAPAPAVAVTAALDESTYCDYSGSPGCPIDVTFTATGFPPNKGISYSLSINGNDDQNEGCGCPATNSGGGFSTTFDDPVLSLSADTPLLIAPNESVTAVVEVGSLSVAADSATGTYTFTAPAVQPYVFVDPPVAQSTGCESSGPGCDYDVYFVDGGFPPDATLSGSVIYGGAIEGTWSFTGTTDAGGTYDDTASIIGPIPGADPAITITVTFGGVTGTYPATT